MPSVHADKSRPLLTHPWAGSNTERESVGDPGHCENCALVGHVQAHPDLGCGGVGSQRVEIKVYGGSFDCSCGHSDSSDQATLDAHADTHPEGGTAFLCVAPPETKEQP